MATNDLRRRLLIAIGAAALPVAAHALDSAEEVEVCMESEVETQCVKGLFLFECPDSSEIEEINRDDIGQTQTPAPGRGELINGECCYEVTVTGTCALGCGCAHGRPLLREAHPLLAGLSHASWIDEALPQPALADLTTAERGRLARFWASVGAHEHSSIAAFHRASLELLAHAAPEKLIAATQRAALDEARHARHAFTLASRFAGATIGPAALPLGGAMELANDLPALAARVVSEGCVEETMSLLAAERMLAGAQDPAVRLVLTKLVRDERRHVELAWKTVKWAIAAGGRPVSEAVAVAFAEARAPVPHDAEPLAPRLAAWGAVADEQLVAVAGHGLAVVIRPVASQLTA
ncbi:hypothetical protein LBMAG42_37200 [Deltaproteobacteria bacterium]|nr:hypothetical protein LBMAG42_37200 [Deltaproteobacteria bacterium]